MEKAKQESTMSEFDRDLIAQFFTQLDRQGPGSDTETLRALYLISSYLPPRPLIADLGCGTGRQSMALAKAMDCNILSVDILPQMIQGVVNRIQKEHLTEQITPVEGKMEHLAFDTNFFDLIWSEGSIYNIGFQNGIKEWRKYLKTGGFLVVTDCAWLTNDRPADSTWLLHNFLDLDSIANKINMMLDAGYLPYGHFILPKRAWEENYYQPMEHLFPIFKHQHPDNESVDALIETLKEEIQYYRMNGAFYGYVFFIGQKL